MCKISTLRSAGCEGEWRASAEYQPNSLIRPEADLVCMIVQALQVFCPRKCWVQRWGYEGIFSIRFKRIETTYSAYGISASSYLVNSIFRIEVVE